MGGEAENRKAKGTWLPPISVCIVEYHWPAVLTARHGTARRTLRDATDTLPIGHEDVCC